MKPFLILFYFLLAQTVTLSAETTAASGKWSGPNRLSHLTGSEPFYPDFSFPKLTTPQWIGEPGVDAVVILSIDDMREIKNYELFLRPILERLKKIDGRAPVSVMACQYPPGDLPHLERWLAEGLSIETHTFSHPCPLLQKGDFLSARANVFDCLDLMAKIPGNKPVAFRMPCCDSMNSPSPRFYAEIFPRLSANGNSLQIDSSIMNIPTTNDISLPRDLLFDADGRERFRKYLPKITNSVTRVTMESFATTITDYPFPYLVGDSCWEFPCAIPSDWEAFNLHGATNPVTLSDWKAGLDVTVLKKGVFTIILHPHGWSSPDQFVQLIQYAQERYGQRVKFLTFKEALEKLSRNLLDGFPIRTSLPPLHQTKLLDLNNDGYLDLVRFETNKTTTKVWNTQQNQFTVSTSQSSNPGSSGWIFGTLKTVENQSEVIALCADKSGFLKALRFRDLSWRSEPALLNGLASVRIAGTEGANPGLQLRDLDASGSCELIVSNPEQNLILQWSESETTWKTNSFSFPPAISLVDSKGKDNGVRFVDVNEDGFDDLIYSNEKEFGLWLYIQTPKPHLGWKQGWNFQARSGRRGDPNEIPMINRVASNNGAWFKNGIMWVQNEDTATMPDKVDRRSFKELLMGDESAPKSVAESLKAFQLSPGFVIECVASEPLVVDPVAFDWAHDGKLWVVEMNDYPMGNGGKGGRVKILEDLDRDGVYDRSTLFLEHLNFPNGIICWGKGAIISAAPDILYAEDDDGDGRAEKSSVLFSGFNEGNQQHRVNGFEYGLDGWIYAANGDSGGVIRSSKTGKILDLRGHDFRFKPETGVMELVEGPTQFGRRRDDWGNWYGNNNPTLLWQYIWPDRYLQRNPFLAVKSSKRLLANYPDPGRMFPASTPQRRFNWPDAVREVTSACSPSPYRDTLFGGEFDDSIFISEPANNVVHREILDRSKFPVESHRAPGERQTEFLASSDNWFRPTMLKTGPDGALYIADMYRLVLEHPEYFPDELKNSPDLRAGENQGRIYRVYPQDKKPRKFQALDVEDTRALATAIHSPSGWRRDTAQRLLLEKADTNAVPYLEDLASAAADSKARLQALWTLRCLGGLKPGLVSKLINSTDANLRVAALVCGETILHETLTRSGVEKKRMLRALSDAASAPEMAVRFQTALSLGETAAPEAADLLMKILRKNHENPWIQNAVISSAPRHVSSLIEALRKSGLVADPAYTLVVSNIFLLATNTAPAEVNFQTIYRTNTVTIQSRKERENLVRSFLEKPLPVGNSSRGRDLYLQLCATCHRFKNEGTQVGPDLGTVADKPSAELITSILNPNSAVDPVYFETIMLLKDGTQQTGVVAGETVHTITLKNAGGFEETIQKSRVATMTRNHRSLMPEGLENSLGSEEMADLLKFLRSR